ncbi:MAG: EI24 domain-containing protein [Pseudomonadota bacterium]|nr:EI24 domain-containing protein [Pseudomonadota bacterium]
MIGVVIRAGLKGLGQVMADGRLRRVLWKAVALSLLAYAIAGGLAFLLVDWLSQREIPWVPSWLVGWIVGFIETSAVLTGLWLMWMLFPVVATAMVSIFVDEIPGIVEARHYPADPAGRDPELWPSLRRSIPFTLLVLAVNLLLLPLYVVSIWIPPIYVAVYFLVNGWFLGREYFELVAIRHHDEAGVYAARKRNSTLVLLTGVAITFGLTLPFVSLVIPVVGVAAMVHIYKELDRRGRIGGMPGGTATPRRV